MNTFATYQEKHFRLTDDGDIAHIKQGPCFGGEGLNELISFDDLEDVWNAATVADHKYSRCECDPSKWVVDEFKITCKVHKMSWPKLEDRVRKLTKALEELKKVIPHYDMCEVHYEANGTCDCRKAQLFEELNDD